MTTPRSTRRLAATTTVATAVCAAVLVPTPAQAATTTRAACSAGVSGTRVCVGVQTTGGDVRGYAKVSDVAGGSDVFVNVRKVVLQRRACGGTWQTWTSVARTGDTSGTSDTDVTGWVVFPARVQFRTVATYSAEAATAPYTGTSGTATSPAYGTC